MSPTRTQDDQRFLELVQAAPFIFTGEVVKPGESTLAIIPAGEGIGVIQVGSVFRSPAVIRAMEGERITLQFARGKVMKKGASALFYASGWLAGNGLAVVEVGREPVPRDRRSTLARIVRAQLRLEDDKLLARVRAADMVVTGLVTSVSNIDRADERGRRSEHDPDWKRAEIMVARFEKGALKATTAAAYFPASHDQMWTDTPKLAPGQRGTLILHRGASGKRGRIPPPGPALLDSLDFQTIAHTERVRALLKLIPA